MKITIHDEKASAVIDTLGAQLISYQDAGKTEYIWQRDKAVWGSCSPLLFPTIGNCRNGRTMIGGIWYDIPKHGFCRDAEFSCRQISEAEAAFWFSSNDQTRRLYPFEFRLTLTYRLQDGALHMTYQVENLQSEPLYYCLGAHPGFLCPMEKDASFEDYILELEKPEHISSIVYDIPNLQFDVARSRVTLNGERQIPLTHELFQDDAIFFDGLISRSVSLIHKDSKKGVQVDFPGFETVAFWTMDRPDATFLCVEPWNGSAIRSDEDDHYEHKKHLQTVAAGESRRHELVIRILNEKSEPSLC